MRNASKRHIYKFFASPLLLGMLTLGKVGVGIIGSQFEASIHAESFKSVPQAKVVAAASPTEAHIREFAKKFGIPKWFTDYRQMLHLDEIEVVTLALPNYLHAQATIDAAEAGKHVICEKPLCMNLEEADAMISACKRNNAKLMYAEELCFAPKYVRAKQLVDEEALGKVYLVKQSEKHFGPHSPWFWDVEKSGGGVFMDMGCHGLEYVRWVYDKPQAESIYADMGTYVHKTLTKGEDDSLAVVCFEGDRKGLIENSWARRGGMDDRVEIFGSEGVVYAYLHMGISLITYSEKGYGYAVEKAPTTRGWTFTVYEELWNYGFPQEMDHFTNCVAKDEKPLETGEDGKAVLELMLAGYESARMGKQVHLPFKPKVKKPIDLWLR